MQSLFLKLNAKDFLKGLLVAVLASILPIIGNALNSNMEMDWNTIAKIAMSSMLGYLVKNYLTDENGKVLGKF